MIVHGMPMRTPQYTEDQVMKKTMLRRSIKDNTVIEDRTAEKLGYEYTRYGQQFHTAKNSNESQ